LYIFWAGWQPGAYGLVLGLVTSVISIYYYIRVVKMMVVKGAENVGFCENYPSTSFDGVGMRWWSRFD
jgi:NAD(P)H-quinone oxidoreductase subunit 2